MSRKKTLPLLMSIGIKSWFVKVEPKTVNQFVPRPELSKFVCICNRQPM